MSYLCANFSLGLYVLDLGPIYATDRQTSDVHHRLMSPTLGRGHNKSATDKIGYTSNIILVYLYTCVVAQRIFADEIHMMTSHDEEMNTCH